MTANSATFTGASGHKYAFYSAVTDNVGLVQATLAGAQATTTVKLPTPTPTPPPVIVTSVHWETIKVKTGNGKKAKPKSETALEIDFSGLVAVSGDLAAYQLASVTTTKVKKNTVTTYKPIKLISALPASSPMTRRFHSCPRPSRTSRRPTDSRSSRPI
jgi:hypothetical protein